jgi:hypothetical protein
MVPMVWFNGKLLNVTHIWATKLRRIKRKRKGGKTTDRAEQRGEREKRPAYLDKTKLHCYPSLQVALKNKKLVLLSK